MEIDDNNLNNKTDRDRRKRDRRNDSESKDEKTTGMISSNIIIDEK